MDNDQANRLHKAALAVLSRKDLQWNPRDPDWKELAATAREFTRISLIPTPPQAEPDCKCEQRIFQDKPVRFISDECPVHSCKESK